MERKREYRHLIMARRANLYLLNYAGENKSQIAKELSCHRSTIYRELKRNSCRDNVGKVKYFPNVAQQKARKRRQRALKLQRNMDLKASVIKKLQAGWSPEMIAGRLKREHGVTVISHECVSMRIFMMKEPETSGYIFIYVGKGAGENPNYPVLNTVMGLFQTVLALRSAHLL